MSVFPENVVCTTSKASDGNMDFRFGAEDAVIANRTTLLQKHGILYEDHIAMQCNHGDIINLVTSFNPEVGARSQEEQIPSEVLVTQEKGLALMLFTADCQPTCFYDPVTETIALAHISRKTLCDELTKKTLIFLQENLCVDPQNVRVHIGPSISKKSYVFPLPLQETHPLLYNFIEADNTAAHIDLVGAHLEQLRTLGIQNEHISVSEDSTADENYFSYYLMKKEGKQKEARMATILMMRD